MSKKADGNVQFAAKTFLRMVISTILCVFMYCSVSIISLGVLGENVGYRIYDTDGALIEEAIYAAGEEKKSSEDLPSDQYIEQIREVPAGVQTGVDVVVQIMMLLIVGAFPYGMLWSLGDRDSNGVRFHHKKYQPLRGLIIGSIANIPYFLLYILLFLSKAGVITPGYLGIFRLVHLPFLPYINMVLNSSLTLTPEASVWQLIGILPVVLVIPVVCCGAYILGFKQISLHERATYKNVGKGNPDTVI